MNIIDTIFKDLIFVKAEHQENYDIYVARIHDRLVTSRHKHVFVFVPYSEFNPSKTNISSLDWKNLQLRDIQFKKELPPQKWQPNFYINPTLYVVERNKENTKYKTDCLRGFTITLLRNPKKKGTFQYNSSMALSTALETGNFTISPDSV